ncbi:MAG: hypothetical protein Kow00127_20280 [Bacteroidales bacterium]
MDFIDWTGTAGTFLILLAYTLNVLGKLSNKSLAFILMNLSGALLACLASVFMKYIPFIILEGVWAAVSLVSLIRRVRQGNR